MTFMAGGVYGDIIGLIGDYLDYDKFGQPKTHFWLYEMHITKVLDQWPEMRQRRWVSA
jgi:diphosphoinositol-polyphosphate diphosphatase